MTPICTCRFPLRRQTDIGQPYCNRCGRWLHLGDDGAERLFSLVTWVWLAWLLGLAVLGSALWRYFQGAGS